MYASNDLKNNSPVIEPLDNRWDVKHPPRTFFLLNKEGEIQEVPIDPEWDKYIIQKPVTTNRLVLYDRWLYKNSRAYYFLSPYLKTNLWTSAVLFRLGIINENQRAYTKERIMRENIFLHEDLPEWGKESIQITSKVLSLFKEDVEKNGARLLVVCASTKYELRWYKQNFSIDGKNGNFSLETERLKQMADEAVIPFLNLADSFIKKPEPLSAYWKYDGHFSETGHKWAAEEISSFIIENGFTEINREEIKKETAENQ